MLVRDSERIDLGDGTALFVVRQESSTEIVVSYVESKNAVKKRTTITLDASQAMKLARALAGVATLED